MYNEEITIYAFLLLTFIALVLFIKYYPFKINIQKPSGLKYEKLNLINGDISILTIKEFNKEIAQLIQNGYALSSLNELYDFVEQQIKLSGKSFVILKEDDTTMEVKSLTAKLLKQNLNIIFFSPVMQKDETLKCGE